MDKIQSFQQYLATQSVQVPIFAFVLNMILVAVLAHILSWIYSRYGTTLSNRKNFGSNFVLLSTTTMLIITVVKSSLALSLGLVGALSIVRFRAAIKEPEELAYLFICIALGLGIGADQTLLTVTAFIIVTAIIVLKRRGGRGSVAEDYNLIVTCRRQGKRELDQIIDILKRDCSSLRMRRVDETPESMEALFLIEFENVEQFTTCKERLREIDASMKISFLEIKGIE